MRVICLQLLFFGLDTPTPATLSDVADKQAAVAADVRREEQPFPAREGGGALASTMRLATVFFSSSGRPSAAQARYSESKATVSASKKSLGVPASRQARARHDHYRAGL